MKLLCFHQFLVNKKLIMLSKFILFLNFIKSAWLKIGHESGYFFPLYKLLNSFFKNSVWKNKIKYIYKVHQSQCKYWFFKYLKIYLKFLFKSCILLYLTRYILCNFDLIMFVLRKYLISCLLLIPFTHFKNIFFPSHLKSLLKLEDFPLI